MKRFLFCSLLLISGCSGGGICSRKSAEPADSVFNECGVVGRINGAVRKNPVGCPDSAASSRYQAKVCLSSTPPRPASFRQRLANAYRSAVIKTNLGDITIGTIPAIP
jgi:hypothetical protein